MKAITICQPYPFLICLPETDFRHKRVENRTWPTSYRGPIAIHAGVSKNWLTLETGDDGKPWDADYEIPLADMVFGAVVATAVLTHCLANTDVILGVHDAELPWLRRHQHASGPFCWVLADVQPLARPIPYRGALSLWEFPDQLLKEAA